MPISAAYARGDHAHPTDTSRAADSLVVHLAGSETVTGDKVFSVSPQVPHPTNNTDAANKEYVLANAGGGYSNLSQASNGDLLFAKSLALAPVSTPVPAASQTVNLQTSNDASWQMVNTGHTTISFTNHSRTKRERSTSLRLPRKAALIAT